MDISKLSRHTKKAKKLIAQALGLGENALAHFGPEEKKIMINISNSEKIIDTINKILGNCGKKINEKGINTKLVIKNICGSDGAAKILSNSMLTKNKAGGGFKKLAEELEKIKYDESSYDSSLRKLPNETIKTKIAETTENNEADLLKRLQGLETFLKTYIKEKKRGALKENGKDAREIDWLKLLCALSVLAAINQLNEKPGGISASSSGSKIPERSSSPSGLETGSVNDEREDEEERLRKEAEKKSA